MGYFAAGFIYALNLRNGFLRLRSVVADDSVDIKKNQRYVPILNNVMTKKRLGKNSYIYDKAVTDFAWWDAWRDK
jgi:hypothetical protein